MIMSDVNDDTLAEMDGLVAEGIPDFKLFTAYPGVFYSDDGAIFRAMQRTAKNGGLIMMHAENGMAIDVVAADEVAAGHTDPYYHGVARYPIFEGEATNRVIRLAEAAGVPVYIVHLSARDALDAVRDARDRGVEGLRRDLPAVPVPVARRHGQRLRGRQVRLLAAAPARPTTRRSCGPGWSRTTCRSSRPTTARSTSTARRSSGEGDFRKVPNGLPGVEDRVDLLHDGGVVARPDHARSAGSRSSRPRRPSCSGCTRGRARSRSAPTPTSSIYDPNATRTISAKTHHMDVDYSCYEGREVRGRSRHRPVARLGHRPRRRVHRAQGPRPVPQARRRRLRPDQLTRRSAGCREPTMHGPSPAATPSRPMSIEADPEQLAEVRAFVRAQAAAGGATEETTADLVQAVDELVCNVIEHGYGHGSAGPIEVAMTTEAEAMIVRIRDRAPAFDPRLAPVPRLDLPLGQRPLGGMGIHLARTLTDAIDHRILPEGGNEVTVTKDLRPAETRG